MIKRTFQSKDLKLNFTSLVNNKINFNYMYIKINTTQNLLLKSLTTKFKFDMTDPKILLGSIPGKNGIIIKCVDKRIVTNILKFTTYLKRTQLKAKQILGEGKIDYAQLMKDMKEINITIIGNCKTFTKNNLIPKETSKKINVLINGITKIEPKDREAITSTNVIEYIPYTKLSSVQCVDMSIIFKCCNFEINGTTINIEKCHCSKLAMYSDTFKSQLKSFRQQFGGISANDDKNDKKHDMINCVMILSQMFTDLKGSKHSLQFSDIITVESDSVKLANNIIKTLCN